MRRLLPLLSLLAALIAPASASAQLIPTTSCGPSQGSEIPIVAEEPQDESANFRLDGAGDMSSDDVLAALEDTYARLVTQFGWTPLPKTAPQVTSGGNKYFVRYGTSGQAGTQTTGDFTGEYNGGDHPLTSWDDEDATATCLVVPDDVTDGAKMRELLAHELSEAIWHGIGALEGTPAPDAWLEQGAAEVMEDEAFPQDDPDSLPPDWDAPLGTYPGGADAWLVLRGLTERFGTGVAGGVEQVVQVAFEALSRRTADDLGALDAGFTGRDVTLPQAFHDYAINAFFLDPCGPATLPYCYADAAGYDAAPREPHGEITALDAPYSGEVAQNYALQWIALPADLDNYDVVVENTAEEGSLQASVACLSEQGPVVTAIGAAAPGESLHVRDVEVAETCASPTLVVSSTTRTGDDPESSPAIGFEATLLEPTAVLTTQSFGGGTIVSLPPGIVCGLDCEQAYPVGTEILLGAVPDEGKAFAGWAGGCSGTEECSFTLEDATTVAAGFVPETGPTGPSGPTGPGGGDGDPTDPNLTGDVTGPAVLIGRPRFARKGTRLRIDIACPAAEPNKCTGPVNVRMRVGRKRFQFSAAITEVAGGDSQLVSFDMTPSVRRALRKKGKRVRIAVTAFIRDDAFNRETTTRTFKVKRPKRVRR